MFPYCYFFIHLPVVLHCSSPLLCIFSNSYSSSYSHSLFLTHAFPFRRDTKIHSSPSSLKVLKYSVHLLIPHLSPSSTSHFHMLLPAAECVHNLSGLICTHLPNAYDHRWGFLSPWCGVMHLWFLLFPYSSSILFPSPSSLIVSFSLLPSSFS